MVSTSLNTFLRRLLTIFLGCRKSDHLWCCGRWFENKKGTYSFRKHLRTHNPELSCMAPIESCNKKFKMFSTIKELNKHYRSSHRLWADANGIPDPSCFCEACGTTFTRPDNRRRHLKNLNFSKCAETIEQMENNDF
ncbi:hypothetical protein M441DRAFT_249473 [Trichoderma asperellum CBS 433.97]|uniref:C2H2-type domain-containing protein n=1 Tax=Trichoderma asperellum (strain ATCC 204424 / CBS 433.97 / NBRC 101777) TaxID=1042311 RepID=A0A2T3Z0A7_TRIA4|nr:hypothetical protein M441DRAFT_249473 [Trichoderma asperellum CBS 433.97]PTB38262.1 hypothetical protein M441DRAFT_249473 [Trichoderma asperellum CBS 433.97]